MKRTIFLSAAVLLAAYATFRVTSFDNTTETSQASTSAETPCPEPRPVEAVVTELGRRDVDPAFVRGWTTPDEDPERIAKLLSGADDLLAKTLEDYDTYEEFDVWAFGYADDSSFGDAIVDCVLDHERNNNECVWRSKIVVKREGDAGRVVAVQANLDDDERACSSHVQCMTQAWQNRKAPPPPNGADYFAFETVSGALGAGGFGDDFRANYEGALFEIEEAMSSAKKELAQESNFSTRHNYTLYASMHRHIQRVLEESK